MKILSKILFILLVVITISTSCKKEDCGKTVPDLSFSQFYATSVDTNEFYLVLKFNDCDGDFGMSPNATIKDSEGLIQETNLKIDLYHLENGIWKKHLFASPEGLNSKVPELGNSDANPELDGEIEVKIGAVSLGGYDTIHFQARILDNAGHYSDWVETPTFIMN